jgi:hemerythrin
MEELISCTVWHFKHEERLMLRYGYRDLVEHRTEHAALIDSAKGLQRKLVHGATPPAAEDIDFLERWLTEHIYGADMALGSYLGELM